MLKPPIKKPKKSAYLALTLKRIPKKLNRKQMLLLRISSQREKDLFHLMAALANLEVYLDHQIVKIRQKIAAVTAHKRKRFLHRKKKRNLRSQKLRRR
jgi:hypothetical protein